MMHKCNSSQINNSLDAVAVTQLPYIDINTQHDIIWNGTQEREVAAGKGEKHYPTQTEDASKSNE